MGLNRFDGSTSKLADGALGEGRNPSKLNRRKRRLLFSGP